MFYGTYDYRHKNCSIVYIKTDDIYRDIAEDLETRLGTSNYELDRLLPKGKNKKVIRWRNHEKNVWSRRKTYSYLMDEGSEDKKQKV